MKSYFLFIVIMIVGLFSSCSNEHQSSEEFSFDNASLKKTIKNQTIDFYNSRKSTLRSSSDFKLTVGEKHQLAQQSLNLLKSYGLTEKEINEDLGGITDDKLIDATFSIIGIEEQANNGFNLIDVDDNFSLLTGEPVLPQPYLRSQIYDCALQAVGIAAIGELISNGIKGMSKSAVKRLLRKVAAKYLGWVGVAIAVYEFGDCMEWW